MVIFFTTTTTTLWLSFAMRLSGSLTDCLPSLLSWTIYNYSYMTKKMRISTFHISNYPTSSVILNFMFFPPTNSAEAFAFSPQNALSEIGKMSENIEKSNINLSWNKLSLPHIKHCILMYFLISTR